MNPSSLSPNCSLTGRAPRQRGLRAPSPAGPAGRARGGHWAGGPGGPGRRRPGLLAHPALAGQFCWLPCHAFPGKWGGQQQNPRAGGVMDMFTTSQSIGRRRRGVVNSAREYDSRFLPKSKTGRGGGPPHPRDREAESRGESRQGDFRRRLCPGGPASPRKINLP